MGSGHSKSAARKRLDQRLGRQALQALSALARVLPERTALRLGSALGSVCYRVFGRYRRVAVENLEQVFGDSWSESRIDTTARDTFRHIGMNLMEFLRFPGMSPDRFDRMVRFEGEEHLQEALKRGKGVLAITSHYGNFELFAAAIVHKGHKLSVIARNADDEVTNNLINDIRGRMGYQVFPRQNAALRSIKALRRNEIIGVLPDQNDLEGIFVPFFGRLAATAQGPAHMALRTGATVLPAFIHREPDNTHVMTIHPPLRYTDTGDRERDIYDLTLAINRAIENAILAHPEQWFWLHNRWKKRPPEEAAGRQASPAGQQASVIHPGS